MSTKFKKLQSIFVIKNMKNFDFNAQSRNNLFQFLLPQLETFYANPESLNVSANWDIKKIKHYTKEINLEKGNPPEQVIEHVLTGLSDYAVHTPHPNYFGLFNPRANFTSILGDLITATFNPQLAAWSHAPFANEIENYVVQEFGKKFGYDTIDGTFCTGGAESNLTAVIAALNNCFPQFNEMGINGIDQQPVVYCSSESHHSIAKAAKMTGLGVNAVKVIPVNDQLQMDICALKVQIKKDRQSGLFPFMVVGTAGTTGAGAVDDLNAVRQIAVEENLWFHVDAAYGGAVVISEKYKSFLSGIEKSDSVTLDLHKWFSIPMGASLFLTSNKKILHQSFKVKTKYMPEDGDPNRIIDPYIHSVQWSRRFMGLKMFLPLAIHGWNGYEKMIDHQIEMGILLKNKLEENGWKILNHSPFPILCFQSQDLNCDISKLVDKINDSGKAWLSQYPVNGQNTCRVCIINYLTGQKELDELIDLLESYRN